MILSGKDCDALHRRDLLAARSNDESRPTFAYSTAKATAADFRDEPRSARVIGNTMTGSDAQPSRLPGYRIIGSYSGPEGATGRAVLSVRRGDRIFYRSGPSQRGQEMSIEGYEARFIATLPLAIDWVTLDFSNSRLPPEFVLRIADNGRNPSEWSAVAIRE